MFLLFLAVLTITTLVSAKYITLTHTVTVEQIVKGDKTTVNITLINSGDEPAYDVQLSLLLPPGIISNQIFLGRVDPNIQQNGTFDVKISQGITPGKYPIVILTEYTDANGYPLSSVSPNSLILKEATSSQIFGRISELTLGDKETKNLVLDLRNLDERDHNILVNLFIPRELKTDSGEKSLMLKAREEKKIDFDISPFGALPGSSYVVFATLEYEDSGLHYSSTASGIVKVVEEKKSQSESERIPFDILFWILIISFIILLIIFLYLKFIKK